MGHHATKQEAQFVILRLARFVQQTTSREFFADWVTTRLSKVSEDTAHMRQTDLYGKIPFVGFSPSYLCFIYFLILIRENPMTLSAEKGYVELMDILLSR